MDLSNFSIKTQQEVKHIKAEHDKWCRHAQRKLYIVICCVLLILMFIIFVMIKYLKK